MPTALLFPKRRQANCSTTREGAGLRLGRHRKQHYHRHHLLQNGLLRHLFVIPLGGHNITKDICNEQVSEEEAEALKCNHGYAASANEDGRRSYHVNEKRTLSAETLNNIIEARTEEILKNVKHQIEVAGYNELLNSGIIYTGGGSKLKGLKEITAICLPKVEMRIAHRIITPLSVRQGAGFEQDVTTTGVLEICCAPATRTAARRRRWFGMKSRPIQPKRR